jgi:heme exporter protein D
MTLGPHAGFILASYGIVVVTLVGLIGWLRYDGARLQRQLDALEARGVRRRSASPADTSPADTSVT